MVWGLYLQNNRKTNLRSTKILKLCRNLSEGLNYVTPKQSEAFLLPPMALQMS